MKYFFLLLLIPFAAMAQQSYWQQQVDYKIEVTLNDTAHVLQGFITMQYKNNSPNTLNHIYLHLWPNAYRNHETALADQLLENGDASFRFSKPSQRGFIDMLSFKVNAEACVWKYDSTGIEIAKLELNEPLKTGESVTIATPFRVKLPDSYSRMGHVGQSYQITQWYPKPAVYDKEGWHAFPYLDQGEFYSEFGTYDVSITLPANYVVGATGDLQNEAEIKWLTELSDKTKTIEEFDASDMKFPKSDSTTKTLRYTQNNIHDFGWFADKRYHVLKGEVELPISKRKVTTWAMFTNEYAEYWTKSSEYLHDAIYYYSTWIGEYPYEQVTAVDGALSAGGGMEYPNVTVIGAVNSAFTLDDVITHEVGHNWFYGILGTNERKHPWMDEGINSYYEYRYIDTKYPNRGLLDTRRTGFSKFLDIDQYKHKYLVDLGYQVSARENLDQPIALTSRKFTSYNYGAVMYGKTMLVFSYLEAYLGKEVFDKVMKKYFAAWKFKHPQPEDLRQVFQQETGKELNWFFDDLVKTTKKIDYKIQGQGISEAGLIADSNSSTKMFAFKNVGDVVSPVIISVLRKDSLIRSVWVEGFKGKTNVAIDISGGDRVQIDPELLIPEINRRNNTYVLNKVAHKFEKLRFQLFGTIENQNRTQVFFAPHIGWNNYDKTQIGLAIYSPFMPTRKLQYSLVPIFGTGSKNILGFARVSYNFFLPKVQRLTVGILNKRFSYLLFPKNLTYDKLEPYISIDFKKKNARSPIQHNLHIRSVNVWLELLDGDVKKTQYYFINELRYRFERNTTLHPMNITATLQHGKNFAGLWAEANFKVSYRQKNQGLSIRVFAGGFPLYTRKSSDLTAPLPKLYLSTVTNNAFAYWLQKDYSFDENFIDRNGRDKYLGRQVALSGGAFRSMTILGATQKFLAASNISSTLYRFIPIRPFASVGMVLNDLNKLDLAAELGLSLVAIPDMIEIHLPLFTTKNIRDNQKILGITKWYQRFTFTLKLPMQRPGNIVKQMVLNGI